MLTTLVESEVFHHALSKLSMTQHAKLHVELCAQCYTLNYCTHLQRPKRRATKHDDYSLRVHYVTSGYSAIVVANRAVVHYVLNSPRHGYVYD